MRRIDEVKSRKMKNVKFVEVVDAKRIRIVFNNNQEIVLKADLYGYYEPVIFIEKDNV